VVRTDKSALLNSLFIYCFGGLCRLPFCILFAQPFAALGLVGEGRPCRFGPSATLAHMVERCCFRLGPCLVGAGEEELKVRTSDDRPRQAQPACSSLAGASAESASSAGFRFAAAILPRLSGWRS